MIRNGLCAAAVLALSIAAPAEDRGAALKGLLDDMLPVPGKLYRFGRTEVTVDQWNAVMKPDVMEPSRDRYPVTGVSWDDCVEFIERLNVLPEVKARNLKFSLPSVKEWRYVCRAGGRGSWGLLADAKRGSLDDMGWHAGNSCGRKSAVARKQPNAWGFYDMHGNVFEWCSDTDGMYGGDFRERAGGSFRTPAEQCAAGFVNSANRQFSRYDDQGFRLKADICNSESEGK